MAASHATAIGCTTSDLGKSGTFRSRSRLASTGRDTRMRKMMTIGLIAIAVVVVAVIVLRPRNARAELLKEGQVAPPFTTTMVTGENEAPVSLSDFHGKKIILYFYPKDETSGCTKEACAFRDGYSRYTNAGLVVLGCSIDSADAHKEFIRKNNLPFPLLLDPDKKIAKAYGAANEIRTPGSDRRIPMSSTRTARS